MRSVRRTAVPPPPYLASSGELAKVREHLGDQTKAGTSYPFAAYRHAQVKQRLEDLFHGKCAYCETLYAPSAPVDVEHYRPKNAPAEELGHPGYWWLAMDWENLLPSCADCNRRREQIIVDGTASLSELWRTRTPVEGNAALQSGKGRSFPVAGHRTNPEARTFDAERPMLLDPCRDDPARHLDFRLVGESSVCLVVPAGPEGRSERGAVTIHAFGLNRLALVQERTRVIRRLEFLRDLVLELDEVVRGLAQPATVAALEGTPAHGAEEVLRRVIGRTLEEMRASTDADQPHSAAAAAWLRDFAALPEPAT